MDRSGFNARVTIRHERLNIDDVVYLKPVEFKYSTPILFAIINRANGVAKDYIDGNEFRNRFEKVD